MGSFSRRDFLHDSAAIAAAVAAAGLASPRTLAEETKEAAKKKGGANDQLNVAVIGLGYPPANGGHGREHVSRFSC